MQSVLTPKGFAKEIKNNEVFVWSVDPDVTDILTAIASGSSSSKEMIRKTPTKEYYHMCGFNRAPLKCMEHQQHNQVFSFVRELPTLKTSNSIDFSKFVSIRIKNYQSP
ncbi:hypothetical protein G6F37_010834 [Rhizopus arrhizus]|nr:hypothetical protein G6F38_008303 [Rhizopus arrhizus]KAG1152223.1 hypothetical protein G6F37_010834 [Rhizopus arrhizus]